MENDPSFFRLRRMSDTSDEKLISEIRRVDAIVRKTTLTIVEFSKHAHVNASTIQKRFGSWESALEKSGISEKFARKGFVRPPGVGRRYATDEDILQELRQLAVKLGRSKLTSDDIRSELGIATQTLINRFGSTRNALLSAGLMPSKRGRRYTDEERFDNLLKVWTSLGRQPTYLEMNKPPSIVGAKAYITRYGGWLRALEAFVERIESDKDDQNIENKTQIEPTEGKFVVPIDEKKNDSKDERSVRMGQRFRILQRDNFKCVLCGNSPAVDQNCRLHVDHTLPFSKGGKTIDSNLRSTCESCNVGRGDRYLE